MKTLKGWWPAYCDIDPSLPRELTGKVEMELEILIKDDADAKPAGRGRDDPNENPHLDDPE